MSGPVEGGTTGRFGSVWQTNSSRIQVGEKGNMPKIGIIYGMENTSAAALVDRINSKGIQDLVAEHIRVGRVKMAQPYRYRVIIDRISRARAFYQALHK